ncbi:MAG: tetratricopeptide repeat protein [Clostridium sp.]|nr:tetratricopeptide repeat protein [Clostridium sp.]
MDKWKILGIDKTKDKEIIKEAYRSRLVHVNPEDDAENFMELRNAYEEALRETEEEPAKEQPEEKGLVYDMAKLYADFKRRIDVEEWRRIFDRDAFVALDTSDASMHRFLSFLMEHSYVPHTVYQLIVKTFHIDEIKGELLEAYPEGFIEHILSNAKYKDIINYGLFDTVTDDVDEFIRMYYRLDMALRRADTEEEKQYIDAVEKIGIYHPYFEISKLRHEFHKINESVDSQAERAERYAVRLSEMQEQAEALLEAYKNETCIMLACGDFAFARSAYDDAGRYYKMAQEQETDNYDANVRLGDYYYAIGEYEKSKAIFVELLVHNGYDATTYNRMVRANEALIKKLKEELAEKPEDNELKFQLAWCYYRNNVFPEAINVLESFAPTDDKKCEYQDLLGRNYLYIGEYEKALAQFFVWKDDVDVAIAQGGNAKEIKEKLRYDRVNYFIADCYIRTKQYDDARKYLEEALSDESDFYTYAQEAMCRLEYLCANYDACILACETLLAQKEDYDAYMYMAKSCDRLGEYSRAIDACEHAMGLYPYASAPYAIELGIYWEFDYYDDMKTVIARFDDLKGNSDLIDISRARLLAHEEDYAASNELLLPLCSKRGTDETDLEEDDWFSLYTLIGANFSDMEEYEKALYYYGEALKEAPENLWVLNSIASAYYFTERFDEAVSLHDKIIGLTKNMGYKKRAYCRKAANLSCMGDYVGAKQVYEACEEEFGFDDDSLSYVLNHAELLVRMNHLQDCARLIKKCICELGYADLAQKYMGGISFSGDKDRKYSISEEQRSKNASLVQSCIGDLCCFYGNEGYIEDAYRIFEMAVENDKTDCHIYRCMGMVYSEHGMYEEAMKMYEKALELDKENDVFISALYLFAAGRMDDITKPKYQHYMELAAVQLEGIDDRNIHFKNAKLAEFYRATGKYEEALAAVSKAIETKRDRISCFAGYHEMWCEKGEIYRCMQEYEKAIACYRQALRIFGHHALYEEHIKECEAYHAGKDV